MSVTANTFRDQGEQVDEQAAKTSTQDSTEPHCVSENHIVQDIDYSGSAPDAMCASAGPREGNELSEAALAFEPFRLGRRLRGPRSSRDFLLGEYGLVTDVDVVEPELSGSSSSSPSQNESEGEAATLLTDLEGSSAILGRIASDASDATKSCSVSIILLEEI